MGTAIKHPVPDRVKSSFLIFELPGTLTLSPGRQSVRMSKITNDGLNRSGTGCFIYSCTHMATVHGRQKVRLFTVIPFHVRPKLSFLYRIVSLQCIKADVNAKL